MYVCVDNIFHNVRSFHYTQQAHCRGDITDKVSSTIEGARESLRYQIIAPAESREGETIGRDGYNWSLVYFHQCRDLCAVSGCKLMPLEKYELVRYARR